MVRLEVVRGDITTLDVDIVVNAANSALMGGGGVDGAIHQAAGPALLAECKEIIAAQGSCEPGNAVITGGGQLRASHVIHTVGPIWREGAGSELDPILASCYSTSLDLAVRHNVASIAFPNISTGVYGYPKARAASVAVGAVTNFLVTHPQPGALSHVLFVCFDDENASLYHARI